MTDTMTIHGLTTQLDGEQRLVGSRCTTCDTHIFPVQDGCPRCGEATELVALPAAGQLWSWTVQRIRPKPPFPAGDEFEPFAVGYVDLGPVRVESPLSGKAPDSWRIGDPVRLAVGTPDDDGAIWSYRFEPDPSPSSEVAS